MPQRRRPLRSSTRKTSLSYDACEQRQLLAAYTATDATDNVVVTFVSGVPATIQINGTLFNNPDATLSIDLGKSLGPNRPDRLTLEGDTFNVTGTATVTDMGGTATDLIAGNGAVNGVLTFSFGTSIHILTGGGNDQFDIVAPYADYPEIDPCGWQPYYSATTGAGNDTFRFSGYVGSVVLGDGNDLVRADPGPPVSFDESAKLRGYFDGGAGTDEFRFGYRLGALYVTGDLTFGVKPANCVSYGEPATGTLGGIESIVNQSGVSPSLVSARFGPYDADLQPGLRVDIHGNRARFTSAGVPGAVDVYGFNQFDGAKKASPQGPESLWNLSAHIWSTAFDLQVRQFEMITVGGNLANGLSHQIAHKLSLYANKIVISASGSVTGREVFLSTFAEANGARYVLSGLTGKSIEFRNYDQAPPPAEQRSFFPAHLLVYGSNTASDRFHIAGTGVAIDRATLAAQPSRVSLYGFGGDELFQLGSTIGGATRNLDRFNGQVDVIGGTGDDQLRIDDRDSGGAWGYRGNDPWFTVADKAGSSSRNNFVGVWRSGIEKLFLFGNSLDNRFWITPSLTTRYVIDGRGNSTSAGDRLILIAPYPVQRVQILRGFGAGTWYFGVNGSEDTTHKSIIYSDIGFAPAP